MACWGLPRTLVIGRRRVPRVLSAAGVEIAGCGAGDDSRNSGATTLTLIMGAQLLTAAASVKTLSVIASSMGNGDEIQELSGIRGLATQNLTGLP